MLFFQIFELRVCFLIKLEWNYRFAVGCAVCLGRIREVLGLQVKKKVYVGEQVGISEREQVAASNHQIQQYNI